MQSQLTLRSRHCFKCFTCINLSRKCSGNGGSDSLISAMMKPTSKRMKTHPLSATRATQKSKLSQGDVLSISCYWMESSVNAVKSIQANMYVIRGRYFPVTSCLDDPSIAVSKVLKSPTVSVLLPISPFRSVDNRLVYFGAPTLGPFILNVMSS